jgi:hypothetical protein
MGDVIVRECKECGNEYPLTRDYFHVDSSRIHGFRDPCKKCINSHRIRSTKWDDYKLGKCSHCGIDYPRTSEFFHRDKNSCSGDGLKYVCKRCINIEDNYAKNPFHHNKDFKKCSCCNQVFPRTNEYFHITRANKFDGLSCYCKGCMKLMSNKRSLKKYKTNIEFRIKSVLRKRVNHALNGTCKADKTMSLLGCSGEFFLSYIELLWTEGMTWDNYGYYGWHIDHIIPCAAFDLTNIKEQKKCFHYTNLQPLWAKDNLMKGSFYEKAS